MAFHNLYSYFATPATISLCISTKYKFRPVHSLFRQSLVEHSNHRYFIDPRPVGYATHLWIVFDRRYICSSTITVSFSRLYRASNILSFLIQCLSEAQGRRFRALLHHSTCQIISSPNNQTFSFFY